MNPRRLHSAMIFSMDFSDIARTVASRCASHRPVARLAGSLLLVISQRT